MRRGFVWFVAVVAVLAIAVSLELTWVHVQVHVQPTHRSVCAIDAQFDCDAVAASPYSALLGVPNALWAAFAYALVLWLALRSRRERDRFPVAPAALLFWGALGMTGYTAFLVIVSFTRLDTFCLFCAALWGLQAALQVALLVAARHVRPIAGLRRELAAVATAPARALVFLAAALALAVALILGVPQLYPADTRPGSGTTVILPAAALPDELPARGPADAPHVLVGFSDYRCPFCKEAAKELAIFRERHPGLLREVHLHFPLEDACNPLLDWAMHRGACLCARAALCAGEQGRFWEMHDALFALETERGWDDRAPLVVARRLGLAPGPFVRCLEDDHTSVRLKAQVDAGVDLKLPGTPTFFLDGRLLVEPLTAERLEALLR